MGMCWCKKKNEEQECYAPQIPIHQDVNVVLPPPSPVPAQLLYIRPTPGPKPEVKPPDPALVDKLILDTLGIIETLVDK